MHRTSLSARQLALVTLAAGLATLPGCLAPPASLDFSAALPTPGPASLAAPVPPGTGELQLELAWPKTARRETQGLPGTIRAYRLSVTAPDLDSPIATTTVAVDLEATRSIRLRVTAGRDRRLSVEALDASGQVVAAGSRLGLSVLPGRFAAVAVVLVNRVADGSGQVIDHDTREPLAGATVSCGLQSTLTDAQGHYQLADMFPGSLTLAVTDAHHAAATRSMAEGPGQPFP